MYFRISKLKELIKLKRINYFLPKMYIKKWIIYLLPLLINSDVSKIWKCIEYWDNVYNIGIVY